MSVSKDKEFIAELEKAATSLLTDTEIMESLDITEEVLTENYGVVRKARLKLKQRLNAKSITDAAANNDTQGIIDKIPVNRIQSYKGTMGGARENAGRPKGTTNKITGWSILKAIELKAGETFENLLAQGYWEAIEKGDKPTRMQYEKMFLSKVVSDRAPGDDGEGNVKTLSNDQLALAIRIAVAAQDSPKTGESTEPN